MADGLSLARPGEEWDQAALRRLARGDYLRICTLRYGREAIIQLGTSEGDVFAWGYEVRASIEDMAWLACEAGHAAALMAKNVDAAIAQLQAGKDDLEKKIVDVATQLKALKDKDDVS